MARLPASVGCFDPLTAFVDCVLQAVGLVCAQASGQVVEAAFRCSGKTVDVMSDFLNLLGRQRFELLNGCFERVHDAGNNGQVRKKCNYHSLSFALRSDSGLAGCVRSWTSSSCLMSHVGIEGLAVARQKQGRLVRKNGQQGPHLAEVAFQPSRCPLTSGIAGGRPSTSGTAGRPSLRPALREEAQKNGASFEAPLGKGSEPLAQERRRRTIIKPARPPAMRAKAEGSGTAVWVMVKLS